MTNTSKQGKGSNKSAAAQQKFVFKGYVNLSLRVGERAEMKVWADAQVDEALLDFVLKAADSGYSVKVGEGAAGMTATLTNIDGPAGEQGYILSAKASSARSALLKLWYYHAIYLDGDWSSAIGSDGDDDF